LVVSAAVSYSCAETGYADFAGIAAVAVEQRDAMVK